MNDIDLNNRIIESTIPPEHAGKRLDHWLSERFTYHSRNQWQDIIKRQEILLNGTATRASRKLQAGDIVAFIPDQEEPNVDVNFEILHEDDDLLVINKPGNLPCHPAGPFFRNTLWALLAETKGKVNIVNRLDRETSGLVLAAKSPEMTAQLSALFTTGSITKTYLAIVFGDFPGDVDATGYLCPDPASTINKKRRFSRTDSTGESSQTYLTRLSANGEFSLVEAKPKTGRLHQIRATLYSLGFPLLGDKLYGPDDTIYLRFANDVMTAPDWQTLVLRRQALHAQRLEFLHPATGKQVSFTAPLPEDMVIPTLSDHINKQ